MPQFEGGARPILMGSAQASGLPALPSRQGVRRQGGGEVRVGAASEGRRQKAEGERKTENAAAFCLSVRLAGPTRSERIGYPDLWFACTPPGGLLGLHPDRCRR